jgi:glycerol-3-phosphate dehydrogenase
MNTPIPQTRTQQSARLTERPLDLLVVGGGIVGAGVARDAAMRGLRVGLVEQHDFAYGTSSRSSRLLHGGLRYLAQGHLGLVREASLEKRTLAGIAPHLAQPLGFLFPAYRGEGPPLWQLRIGVKIYDLLCSGRNFQPSRAFSLPETRALLPGLKLEALAGSVRYFDALTNDARLVLDTLRSAAHHGAAVLNYTRLGGVRRQGNLWHCQLEDRAAGATATVQARVIVNATGPWSDRMPHSAVRLRLTKGIHLVVDQRHLPVPSAVVITEGKRILFVLPWGNRVIVGTTDTDYEGAPEDAVVEPSDVDYVLRTVNRFFPRAFLAATDIISSWAGLRPLVANPDGSPSDISREHEITSPEPGWWDITGGKLTTYRLMAEQTVDRVARELGRAKVPCRTAIEPLLADNAAAFSSVIPGPCTEAAVRHYVEREWALRLTDVMVRRSSWHYYHGDADRKAEQVAAWMARIAGWTPARCADELARYRAAASEGSAAGSPPAGSSRASA